MARWVKLLVSKSYNLCSISRTHTEEKNEKERTDYHKLSSELHANCDMLMNSELHTHCDMLVNSELHTHCDMLMHTCIHPHTHRNI